MIRYLQSWIRSLSSKECCSRPNWASHFFKLASIRASLLSALVHIITRGFCYERCCAVDDMFSYYMYLSVVEDDRSGADSGVDWKFNFQYRKRPPTLALTYWDSIVCRKRTLACHCPHMKHLFRTRFTSYDRGAVQSNATLARLDEIFSATIEVVDIVSEKGSLNNRVDFEDSFKVQDCQRACFGLVDSRSPTPISLSTLPPAR